MGMQYHDKYGQRVGIGFDEKFWDPYHNGKELDEAAYNKIAAHTANLENFYANGGNSDYKSPFDLFAKAAGSDARAGDSHGADVGKVGKIFDHIYNWQPKDGDGGGGGDGSVKNAQPTKPPEPQANPPSEGEVTADLNESQAIQPAIVSAEEMAGQYQNIFQDQKEQQDAPTEEQKTFRALAKERAQNYAEMS